MLLRRSSGLLKSCSLRISNGNASRLTDFGYNADVSRKTVEIGKKFSTVGVAAKPCAAYPGEPSVFTTAMEFKRTQPTLPTYRIMDEFGNVLDQSQLPPLDKATVVKMYTSMITLTTMDSILYNVQRQGRISFYMTHFGEEATHFGSAAALQPEDNVFAQYREAGVLMWRGFTLDEFMNQCYSNALDYGKGRQMPVHYGSKRLNFQTISSPLATQIPQAVGSAYAQKLQDLKTCTICYFGEGAASEGDFHAALNMAATLQTPTIFFCRNNRWAISTPSTEQYKGDGIGARGVAYGIDTIRVDGNDIFAVYNATLKARKLAVEQNKPTLIEAMTYRVGHHSTSDDASRYRPDVEVDQWKAQFNPITRLRNFLLAKNWWSEEEEKQLTTKAKQDVLDALKRAEHQKKPALSELWADVYDKLPPNLVEQKKQLEEHLAKYPENYPIDQHAH
eukprot:TRINITY_DN1274_c0_g1_i1.p1 TRINITY_DN1274_c0_g1~~TRINITY_DN1274_c0_g1_i1.p1  ORF type:complete len:448 (+),score=86.68 TRINITY_DN1274_c0_g1_i1:98-1441(+)